MKRKRYREIENYIDNPSNEYFRILNYFQTKYGPFNESEIQIIEDNPHFERHKYEPESPDEVDLFSKKMLRQMFEEGQRNDLVLYVVSSHLTFDEIQANPELEYFWPSLVRHDIPLSFIFSIWKKVEPYFQDPTFRKERICNLLSSHPQISNRLIEDNLNFPWNWSQVLNRPRFDLQRWLERVYPLLPKDNEAKIVQAFLSSSNLTFDFLLQLEKTRLKRYIRKESSLFLYNQLKRDIEFAKQIIVDTYRRYRSRKILATISCLNTRLPTEIVLKIIS